MDIRIEKSLARGSIKAPPSKSMAHRLLICAALAEGESVIHGVSSCDDVLATIDCLSELGAKFEYEGDTVKVTGANLSVASPENCLFCRESGSTLRFLVPICLLLGKNVMMTGSGTLMQRPLGVYLALAKEKGLTFLQDESSIVLRGPLAAGEYRIAGNVSSQFISGLMFALPLADGDSKINIIPPVVSRPYIDMTLEALREFGIKIEWEEPDLFHQSGLGHLIEVFEVAVLIEVGVGINKVIHKFIFSLSLSGVYYTTAEEIFQHEENEQEGLHYR